MREQDEDSLDCARGILLGLVLAVLTWASVCALLWLAAWLVT